MTANRAFAELERRCRERGLSLSHRIRGQNAVIDINMDAFLYFDSKRPGGIEAAHGYLDALDYREKARGLAREWGDDAAVKAIPESRGPVEAHHSGFLNGKAKAYQDCAEQLRAAFGIEEEK